MEDISEQLLERIARRLKAMANPFRLRILHTLEHGELSVNQILEQVGGSQGNVSKHLSVLRGSELVTQRRDGTNIFYSIADEAVFEVCRTVCDSLQSRALAEVEVIGRARAQMLGSSVGDSVQ